MNSFDFCKACSLASLEIFGMVPAKVEPKSQVPTACLKQTLQGKRSYDLTQSMHGKRSYKFTQSMHDKRNPELTQMLGVTGGLQSTCETDMRDWQTDRLSAILDTAATTPSRLFLPLAHHCCCLRIAPKL